MRGMRTATVVTDWPELEPRRFSGALGVVGPTHRGLEADAEQGTELRAPQGRLRLPFVLKN
jgi:hypothetical protein